MTIFLTSAIATTVKLRGGGGFIHYSCISMYSSITVRKMSFITHERGLLPVLFLGFWTEISGTGWREIDTAYIYLLPHFSLSSWVFWDLLWHKFLKGSARHLILMVISLVELIFIQIFGALHLHWFRPQAFHPQHDVDCFLLVFLILVVYHTWSSACGFFVVCLAALPVSLLSANEPLFLDFWKIHITSLWSLSILLGFLGWDNPTESGCSLRRLSFTESVDACRAERTKLRQFLLN